MRVTIIEKPKKGKKERRKVTHNIELAEIVLTKKRGWELPEDSPFEIKDGKLQKKEVKKTVKKATSKE